MTDEQRHIAILEQRIADLEQRIADLEHELTIEARDRRHLRSMIVKLREVVVALAATPSTRINLDELRTQARALIAGADSLKQ